jgi:DNA-directed RNA polymerase specialized sigma24 family protein
LDKFAKNLFHQISQLMSFSNHTNTVVNHDEDFKIDQVSELYRALLKVANDKRIFTSSSNFKSFTKNDFAAFFYKIDGMMMPNKKMPESAICASDIIQDSLIAFIRFKERSQKTLNDIAYFKTIVVNKALKTMKKRGVVPDTDIDNLEDPASRADETRFERLRVLFHPDLKYKGEYELKIGEIISLFANGIYLWQYKDISMATGIIEGTLKSNMSRAKQQIRQLIEAKFEEMEFDF